MILRLAALVCVLISLPAWAQQTQLQLDRNNPNNNTVGQLHFMGAVVIPMGADKVGGLSSLYIGPHDTQFISQADTGKLYTGTLKWTGSRLTGATVDKGNFLLDENGQPPTSRARYDSESLARLPNGDWLVGFERDHRIEQYSDDHGKPNGTPKLWPAPPGLAELPRNLGLESLTVLKNGNPFAIAETVSNGISPAWLWQEGHWNQLSYGPADGLAPSDAATLPNGDVVVLERGLNLFYGFRCRIVLLKSADIIAGATLKGTELARLESPLLTENFEGISALPRPDGKVRLFIISDNNMSGLEQTILAAFELTSH